MMKQDQAVPEKSTFIGYARNMLCDILGVVAMSALIGASLGVLNARADDQSGHTEHDNMPGMHDMAGMHDMDHSGHEHYLSGKRAYTRSLKSYDVPELKLVDMNGKQVALRELLDDRAPILLNFIFTSCTTICPVMIATFQQVQNRLGVDRKGARLVSISIDPENDTPDKLKEYAAKYQAGSRWTLLTGSVEDSQNVQRAFGVFAGDKMDQKPVTLMKAKGSGKQWVRLDGLADAGQIVSEYDKLNMKK
ncbi:MAG: SCO family protein [Nitrosomonadales bacterium]|nr:SCO family protein [Nitrosomonadales bacterium]